jgi:hypothetical protein
MKIEVRRRALADDAQEADELLVAVPSSTFSAANKVKCTRVQLSCLGNAIG